MIPTQGACLKAAYAATIAVALSSCAPVDGAGISQIREADLRADIDIMAGDGMRGRGAGTIDEIRASIWLAKRASEAGLLPAGDDGTYFQFWSIRRTRMADRSSMEIDGQAVRLWQDAIIMQPTEASLDEALVDVGTMTGDGLSASRIRGRPVLARLTPPDALAQEYESLQEVRYTWMAVTERSRELIALGATAVILIGDPITDQVTDWLASWQKMGTFAIDSEVAAQPPTTVPVVLLRSAAGNDLGEGSRLRARFSIDSFIFPSVNVAARVAGTDDEVSEEHVLFSAHVDHDGIRNEVDGDSIWNGADDNASASVALLAIGRAYVADPGRRSALFIWHGSEERGLLGSQWHAQNPVIPLENIVTVLNADMIGRNHPDSVALLGVQRPNRNSSELVELALAANEADTRFAVDSVWDSPDHPERFFTRSDHAAYAGVGIPALFFSTLLHPDYHTERDEPAAIDVVKLARVARWIYATGWAVTNADVAPALDPDLRQEP